MCGNIIPCPKHGVQKNSIPDNGTPDLEGGYIGAAPAIKSGDAHILIFGGAGGKQQLWEKRLALQNAVEELKEAQKNKEIRNTQIDSLNRKIAKNYKNTSFSRSIWAYHTITDTWVKKGEIPGLTQVVTSALQWGGRYYNPCRGDKSRGPDTGYP